MAVAEAPKEIPPPEPFAERLAAVRAADTPLLEASRVLLRAQADMPDELDSKQTIATVRSLLDQELRIFHNCASRRTFAATT
jgi:type VI secretion system protein ImpK